MRGQVLRELPAQPRPNCPCRLVPPTVVYGSNVAHLQPQLSMGTMKAEWSLRKSPLRKVTIDEVEPRPTVRADGLGHQGPRRRGRVIHQVPADLVAGIGCPGRQQQLGRLDRVGRDDVDRAAGGSRGEAREPFVAVRLVSDARNPAGLRVQFNLRRDGLGRDINEFFRGLGERLEHVVLRLHGANGDARGVALAPLAGVRVAGRPDGGVSPRGIEFRPCGVLRPGRRTPCRRAGRGSRPGLWRCACRRSSGGFCASGSRSRGGTRCRGTAGRPRRRDADLPLGFFVERRKVVGTRSASRRPGRSGCSGGNRPAACAGTSRASGAWCPLLPKVVAAERDRPGLHEITRSVRDAVPDRDLRREQRRRGVRVRGVRRVGDLRRGRVETLDVGAVPLRRGARRPPRLEDEDALPAFPNSLARIAPQTPAPTMTTS